MKKIIDGNKFIKTNPKTGMNYIELTNNEESLLEVQECILNCLDKKGNKIELIMDKKRFEDWVNKLKYEKSYEDKEVQE